MRPNHVLGRSSPPYRVLVPVRPTGTGLHRADHRPVAEAPVAGARLALSIGVLVAVPLLALNLRPAVTSVGAMLTDIRSGTGMSTVLASAVVAAPVWCFAAGGALAWTMRSRFGTARTVSLALAVLAATLASRVLAGPFLLLAGTIVACLAIAVLGTLLPVITHAAPAKAWALLTGCYVAAMGGGSGIGALVTPQVSGQSSWQLGVSGWALLAAAAWAAWRVASRKFSEPAVKAKKHPGPSSLRPAASAWSLTIHFGLTSGFTFSIMGWLPSMLLDYSRVDPARVEWMFTVAMALGVPVALMVPKWARATVGQSGLAVLLAAPGLVAIVGLLMFPTLSPWLWSIGLGLEMPAVGLALTMISLRAAPDGDTAAALSSMVQGIGYAIAGATALGCGLLHSSTSSWEWPLLALLVVLCGQIVSGMHAGLPIVVHTGRSTREPAALPSADRRALPPARAPEPPAIPAQRSHPPVLARAAHSPVRSRPAHTPPQGVPVAHPHGPQGWPAHPPMIAGWPVPSQFYAPPARGPQYGTPPNGVPMNGAARYGAPNGNGFPSGPNGHAAPLHGPFPPPLYGPFTPPRNVPAGPPMHGRAGSPPMHWPPVPPNGLPPVPKSAMSDAPVTESLTPRTESINPRTESINPRTESMSPRTESLSSRTESMRPKTRSIVPKPRNSEPAPASPTPEPAPAPPNAEEALTGRPVAEPPEPTMSAEPESVAESAVETPVAEDAAGSPEASEVESPEPEVAAALDGDTDEIPLAEQVDPPTDELFGDAVIPQPRDGDAPFAGPPAPGAPIESPRVEAMISGAGHADEAVAASDRHAEAPIAEASVAQASVAETSVAEAAVVEASVAEAPVAEAPVAEAPVAEASVAEAVVEPEVAEPEVAEVTEVAEATGGDSGPGDVRASGAARYEAGEAHSWVPWVPDSAEPVQLELALEPAPPFEPPAPLEPMAAAAQPALPLLPVDPEFYLERTIHIPHPRNPST